MNEEKAKSYAWRVGDRVSLCPNGRESDRCEGTITAINEEGLPRGVRVRFDGLLCGVDNCYASHDELTLIRRASRLGDSG